MFDGIWWTSKKCKSFTSLLSNLSCPLKYYRYMLISHCIITVWIFVINSSPEKMFNNIRSFAIKPVSSNNSLFATSSNVSSGSREPTGKPQQLLSFLNCNNILFSLLTRMTLDPETTKGHYRLLFLNP